jgi:hypothetical protein
MIASLLPFSIAKQPETPLFTNDVKWALVQYNQKFALGDSNSAIGTLVGVANYRVSNLGNELNIPSNSVGALSYGTNSKLQLSSSSGVMVVTRLSSTATALFTTNYGVQGINPGGFYIGFNGTDQVEVDKQDLVMLVSSTNTIGNGQTANIAWSYNNTTGSITLVVNGVVTTATSSQSFTHGVVARGGFYSNISVATNSHNQSLFAITPEIVSLKTLQKWSKNPWSILRKSQPIFPFLTSSSSNGSASSILSGVTITPVSGSAQATANATSSLSGVSITPVSSVASGSASVTATLQSVVVTPISGIATGSAAASSTLSSVSITLVNGTATGTTAGNATATASLSGIAITPVSVAASGTALSSGSITSIVITPVSASASASAAVTANISSVNISPVSAAAIGTFSGNGNAITSIASITISPVYGTAIGIRNANIVVSVAGVTITPVSGFAFSVAPLVSALRKITIPAENRHFSVTQDQRRYLI